MTPWKSSSRTGSRRSRHGLPRPLLLPGLLALLAAAGPAAAGQELALSVRRDALAVSASAAFTWGQREELAATLRDGLESRITFTLRVFEKSPGLRSLLGDRLLAEKTITRAAYYNFLDADYVVEEATGGRAAFAGVADALTAFFSVRDAALCTLRRDQAGRCYAAVQVQFDPVRLMPPLTIVSLAGAGGRVTTPWVRVEVAR